MSRTTNHAHQLVTDAHVVAADIEAALAALHDCRGGYPASTPGAGPAEQSAPIDYDGPCAEVGCSHARPCPDHDTPVTLTQTERDATTLDRARLDHIALTLAVRRAAAHAAEARAIVDRWANPADTATAVAKKLQGDDKSIWCRNCAVHGVNNVSVPQRVDCKFCAEFRRTWGTPPNRAILEIHGHRRVTPQDAVRILDRDVPGWRKTMPKPKAPKGRKGSKAAA